MIGLKPCQNHLYVNRITCNTGSISFNLIKMPAKVHDLDLAKLRAFEIVAHNGTLQVAAARLNLTVSAISTQLKRLEELLGVELFRRTPSKLVITPEGERFAADVTQILDMTERALTRLGERGSHSGHVNISLGGDYAWLFMPKINSFSAQHPKITTTIKIHRGTESMTAVQKGTADFSIGAFLRRPKGLRFRTVATSTMSIIFNERDRVDPQAPLSAVGDRLLVAPRSATVRSRLAKSQALKTSVNYLECPTCHTAIDLVKRESGPAIVHTFCLNQVEADGIRAIDLGKSFGVEQFVIAYSASTLKQSVMRDLLEWLTR
jgi:DNA-binding transcriptional LysR family regulator